MCFFKGFLGDFLGNSTFFLDFLRVSGCGSKPCTPVTLKKPFKEVVRDPTEKVP